MEWVFMGGLDRYRLEQLNKLVEYRCSWCGGMDEIDIEFGGTSTSAAPVSARELLGRDIFDIPDEIVQEPAFENEISATDLLNEYRTDDPPSKDEEEEEEEKKEEDEKSESSSEEEEKDEETSKNEESENPNEEVIKIIHDEKPNTESVNKVKEEEEEEEEDDGEVDWDKVNEQTIEKSQNEIELESITYSECLDYFYTKIGTEEEIEGEEQEQEQMSFLERLLRSILCISLPEKLSPQMNKERERIQNVMKISLDHSDEIHKRMMFSMYKLVKKEDKNPSIIGEHWIDVGFQRNDPKTDLRGSGVFGVIQLLHFLQTNQDLAVDIYEMSKISGNPFPFACVGLNWTSSSLRLLNSGKLDYLIREKNSVVEALDLAYMAIFFDFYLKWRKEGWTVREYGEAKKGITKSAMGNIKKMIKRFELECNKVE